MKHVHLLAGASLALVLIACGGSDSVINNNGAGTGNNSGATGTGTTINPAALHIEAVVLNPTSFDNGSMTGGQTFIIQDLTNIESEDQIQLELVYYDSSGNRIVISPGGWSSSDTQSQYGQLTYNSGIFVASNAQNLTPLTFSTTYNGYTYSAYYDVLPRQVRLRGMVRAADTSAPVYGAEVDFYGPQNPTVNGSPLVFVGKVISAYDGTFRASIPPSATNFTVTNASVATLPAPGYQRIEVFQGAQYPTGQLTCMAPVQTYTDGERFMIDFSNSNNWTNGTVNLVSANEPDSKLPSSGCSVSATYRAVHRGK